MSNFHRMLFLVITQDLLVFAQLVN